MTNEDRIARLEKNYIDLYQFMEELAASCERIDEGLKPFDMNTIVNAVVEELYKRQRENGPQRRHA